MKTLEDVKTGKERLTIKSMLVGESGSGKTHLAATHPKCYFLITEPGGKDTFLTNPNLQKNIVGWDEFIPQSIEDTKDVFDRLEKAIVEAKRMALEGKIETLVLDNLTFLSENRWMYIGKYEPTYSGKSGEIDTRGMYGTLSRWLYQFILMKILTFPGNVVVTCHEMLESDDNMEKKPDKTTPILANILGGFRDKADGMFSLVLFLSKVKSNDGKFHYFARTNKGMGRNAKSRFYNLPEVIENVSFQTILEVINKTMEVGNAGRKV